MACALHATQNTRTVRHATQPYVQHAQAVTFCKTIPATFATQDSQIVSHAIQ
jgi:hypothetical protein